MKKTYAQELLDKETSFFKKRIQYAKKHKENLEKTYQQISQSKAYRLWQKASKLKRGIALMSNPQTMKVAARLIHQRFLGNPVDLPAIELSHHERKYIDLVPELPKTQTFKNVSIIIPTYNGAEELPRLFKAIDAQQRIIDPEIIIIDSESTDNTKDIAEKHGAVFLTVKKEDFNHGETRNTAAKHAKGKYLIFTVQDEIPSNRSTFADLLTLLTSSEAVVAASTKQIPFPDADMFARWQILNHLSALQLNGVNFTMSYNDTIDFYKQSFLLKRKLALLDDVCCAVKKKEFMLLGGYKKADFAEDVDLAIRALTNKYSIGFLGTNGVIHSHTRTSAYFLKRSFADVNTVHTMFKEVIPSMFSSLDELMSVANKLYKDKLAFKKDDQLQQYMMKLTKDLDLNTIDNESIRQTEEMYWEVFNNVLQQGLALFKDEDISDDAKKEFSQKLFSSMIGSQIAIFMLDGNISKSTEQVKKVENILLDNV